MYGAAVFNFTEERSIVFCWKGNCTKLHVQATSKEVDCGCFIFYKTPKEKILHNVFDDSRVTQFKAAYDNQPVAYLIHVSFV